MHPLPEINSMWSDHVASLRSWWASTNRFSVERCPVSVLHGLGQKAGPGTCVFEGARGRQPRSFISTPSPHTAMCGLATRSASLPPPRRGHQTGPLNLRDGSLCWSPTPARLDRILALGVSSAQGYTQTKQQSHSQGPCLHAGEQRTLQRRFTS